MGETGVSWV